MTDTEHFRERLEEEKTSLETQLQDVAQPDPANPGEWEAVQKELGPEADPNDQASQLDDYQENRAIADVLNTRHKEVLAALARINDGTYGTCSVCGNEIEADRLEADPAAQTCKADLAS